MFSRLSSPRPLMLDCLQGDLLSSIYICKVDLCVSTSVGDDSDQLLLFQPQQRLKLLSAADEEEQKEEIKSLQ